MLNQDTTFEIFQFIDHRFLISTCSLVCSQWHQVIIDRVEINLDFSADIGVCSKQTILAAFQNERKKAHSPFLMGYRIKEWLVYSKFNHLNLSNNNLNRESFEYLIGKVQLVRHLSLSGEIGRAH